ncbi:uncharacterized protein [Panulirus ornatus]|uniref:uncharacterized protein isoform X1 n=1 Tax=Panulirus ornatus TaxID=150431 RepID=UPI003A858061
MQREAITGRLTNPGSLTPMFMTNQWQPITFTQAQCTRSVVPEHRGFTPVCEWAGVQCCAGVGRGAAPSHHTWPQQPSVLLDVPRRASPAPHANASLRINLQRGFPAFGRDSSIPALSTTPLVPPSSHYLWNDRLLQGFPAAGRHTSSIPALSTTPWNPPLTPPAPATAGRNQRGGFRLLEIGVREEQSTSSASGRRRQRRCAFCAMNGEEDIFHVFKDRRGRVVCPVLSSYICRICGATGYSAHTIKYCPRNRITKGDPVAAGLPPGIMPSCFKYEDII